MDNTINLGQPTVSESVSYAGFWARVLAIIIDAIILAIIGLAISFIDSATGFTLSKGVVNSLIVLISLIYFTVFESSKIQATFGKMALGIKVTDLVGNRISWLRALGRYFAKILSAVIFGIGYLMVAFTSKKQALHDMIAGTLVINE